MSPIVAPLLAFLLQGSRAEDVPYVVLPAERPWEAEAFRALPLESRPAKGEASANVRSLAAGAAGLNRLERGSVRLFHSAGRKGLAEEIATLMERQHRLAWIRELFASLAAEPAPERGAFLARVERLTGEEELAKRLVAVPLGEVRAYLERGLAAGGR